MLSTQLNSAPAKAKGGLLALTCLPMLALIARKTLLQRQRTSGGYDSIDGSAGVEILFVCFGGLLLLTPTLFKFFESRLKVRSFAAMLLFGLFGIFSCLWSLNIIYTGFQAAQFVVMLLLTVAYIGRAPTFKHAERRLIFLVLFALVCGILRKMRYYGLSMDIEAWRTNEYTATAAMLFTYCCVELIGSRGRRRWMLVGCGLFSLAGLALGTSAASIISVAGGLCVGAMLLGNSRVPLLLLVMTLGCGAFFFPDKATEIVFPLKDERKVETLSGRRLIYERLFTVVEEEPLLGVGYSMASKLPGVQLTHAHNSLLSVVVGTGFVGLSIVLVFAVLFFCEVGASYIRPPPGSIGTITAVLVGMANSMSVSFFGENCRPATFALLAFYALHVALLFIRSSSQASGRN